MDESKDEHLLKSSKSFACLGTPGNTPAEKHVSIINWSRGAIASADCITSSLMTPSICAVWEQFKLRIILIISGIVTGDRNIQFFILRHELYSHL